MTTIASNWTNKAGISFNDIYIDEGGNLVLCSGTEMIKNAIATNLWLWISEYEYNTTIGVPYKTILGNPNVDQSYIQYHVTKAIFQVNTTLPPATLAIYGIKSVNIDSYEFIKESRRLVVNITATLNNGSTVGVIV